MAPTHYQHYRYAVARAQTCDRIYTFRASNLQHCSCYRDNRVFQFQDRNSRHCSTVVRINQRRPHIVWWQAIQMHKATCTFNVPILGRKHTSTVLSTRGSYTSSSVLGGDGSRGSSNSSMTISPFTSPCSTRPGVSVKMIVFQYQSTDNLQGCQVQQSHEVTFVCIDMYVTRCAITAGLCNLWIILAF